MTRLVVTGASGFLGRMIVNLALAEPLITHVSAIDRVELDLKHPKLAVLTCDLKDKTCLDAVSNADIVIHLAATLGGAAESNPVAARHLNLDVTHDLLACCSQNTRFVFASTLAVLGETADSRAPTMIYGAHKAMAEIAIETATRRGEVDGISLRPGGIVARAGMDSALKSAFLSQVFWSISTGNDITLPVSAHGETWLASVRNVAENFMHAALTPQFGPIRSMTLPRLKTSFEDLVQALYTAFPNSTARVTYAPDTEIMHLFGHAQPIEFKNSLAAGFVPDSGLNSLIRDALSQGELS